MKCQGSQFAQQIDPPTVKAEQWKQCLCTEFVVMLQFKADRKFIARIAFVVTFCNERALLLVGTYIEESGTRAKSDNKTLDTKYFNICVNLLSIKFRKQCATISQLMILLFTTIPT